MIRIKCEACGSTELKKSGTNMCVCEYCGSKYFLEDGEKEIGSELTNKKVIALIEKSKDLNRNNKFAEELEVLNEALELDGNNSIIFTLLGRCYRLSGNSGKALEAYRHAIDINPNEGLAYTNMGIIYTFREDYKAAKECYDKGLPLIDKGEFDYWIAYANSAISVAKLGNPKEAEKMISKAEEKGYKNGDAIRKMAGIKKKSFFTSLFG